jgi:hypothetical protein
MPPPQLTVPHPRSICPYQSDLCIEPVYVPYFPYISCLPRTEAVSMPVFRLDCLRLGFLLRPSWLRPLHWSVWQADKLAC